MNLQAAVVCHVGCVRTNNEDNYYLQGQIRQSVDEPNTQAYYSGTDTCALFAVADGMGGQAQGELASLSAVQALRPCSFEQSRSALHRSISKANAMICRDNQRFGCRRGTTLAAVCIDAGKAVACNIGDSRIYWFHGGKLIQLSTDHTQVQQMVALGLLTPDAARNHPNRNILTQHLGIPETEMLIQPSFSEDLTPEAGDRFLLCSDGLTDAVTEDVICRTLCSGEPEQQAQALIEHALSCHCKDNVTAMIIGIYP